MAGRAKKSFQSRMSSKLCARREKRASKQAMMCIFAPLGGRNMDWPAQRWNVGPSSSRSSRNSKATSVKGPGSLLLGGGVGAVASGRSSQRFFPRHCHQHPQHHPATQSRGTPLPAFLNTSTAAQRNRRHFSAIYIPCTPTDSQSINSRAFSNYKTRQTPSPTPHTASLSFRTRKTAVDDNKHT